MCEILSFMHVSQDLVCLVIQRHSSGKDLGEMQKAPLYMKPELLNIPDLSRPSQNLSFREFP